MNYILLINLFTIFPCNFVVKAQSLEYNVKAIYLEKFARFTKWNNGIKGENFVIEVFGNSPFNGELEKLAAKTKIKNKPVKIIYSNEIDLVGNNNLLFICSSEKNKIPSIVKKLESSNILIVSNTEGSCKKGVHLSFYIDNFEKIKYEVNPAALKKSNLSIEMTLLKFGKIIQ